MFTNLSPDHIGPGEHADLAEYLHWKAALFPHCAAGVFNNDDAWVGKIRQGAPCRAVTYGIDRPADLRADADITLTRTGGRLGAAFTVDGVPYTVGMPGAFSVYNALAALAAARLLGAGEQAVRRGLAEAVVRGRVEPAAVGAPFTVLIDYAHNEAAAESLLRTLRAYKPARLIAVFGCGGDRDSSKRPIMGKAALAADYAVVTSDNPRTENPQTIIDDILDGMREGEDRFDVEPDRRSAIACAIAHASAGDAILIAGKGHEDYQIIGTEKHHFDDREVAAEELEKVFG